MTKQLKTGLLRGRGRAPGYRWRVDYLTIARDEAMAFLTPAQYEHVVDLVRALAMEPDPTHPITVTVASIEDFFELKDKGGPLGRINLRLFFAVTRAPKRSILVLGAFNKKADGATPQVVKIAIARRLRKYLAGAYG